MFRVAWHRAARLRDEREAHLAVRHRVQCERDRLVDALVYQVLRRRPSKHVGELAAIAIRVGLVHHDNLDALGPRRTHDLGYLLPCLCVPSVLVQVEQQL